VVTELAEDKRAISDHLEVGPAVVRSRLQPRDQSVVFRLVVGCGAMRLAHGRAPNQRTRTSRAGNSNHAGTSPAWAGVPTRPTVKEKDVDVTRRQGVLTEWSGSARSATYTDDERRMCIFSRSPPPARPVVEQILQAAASTTVDAPVNQQCPWGVHLFRGGPPHLAPPQ
jgi:hypothetical protein